MTELSNEALSEAFKDAERRIEAAMSQAIAAHFDFLGNTVGNESYMLEAFKQMALNIAGQPDKCGGL